jgi:hypothetical protein
VNFDWLDFAGYCLPETVTSAMASNKRDARNAGAI